MQSNVAYCRVMFGMILSTYNELPTLDTNVIQIPLQFKTVCI